MNTPATGSKNSISRLFLIIASLLGAAGVGIGAYISHGLGPALEKQEVSALDFEKRMDQGETGVKYHMYHTLAILVLAATGHVGRSKLALAAALFMLLGIGLFSCILYTMAIANSGLHYIVPFGGLSFILGWLLLACSSFSLKDA